jgi:hypothetical protein
MITGCALAVRRRRTTAAHPSNPKAKSPTARTTTGKPAGHIVAALGFLLLALAAPGLHPTLSQAQQFTWTGEGPDNNWSTASNWLNMDAPISGSTTRIRFEDSTIQGAPFQDIGTPFLLNGLEFGPFNGATQFNMLGQSLEFVLDTTSSQSPEVVIKATNNVAGNIVNVFQDWSFSSPLTIRNGGFFNLERSITGNGDLLLLGVAGEGYFSVGSSGQINNSGSLVLRNGGTLELNGTLGPNVSELVMGRSGVSDGADAHLRGTGVVNQNIILDLSASRHTFGSSDTLTVNGSVSSGIDNAGRLYVTEGNVSFNGLIEHVHRLVVEEGALLSGNGGINATGLGRAILINGRIGAEQNLFFNGLRGGNFVASSIQGSGVIDAETVIAGGLISGSGLTFNNTVTIIDGTESVHIGWVDSVHYFNSRLQIEATNFATTGTGLMSGQGEIVVGPGAEFHLRNAEISTLQTFLNNSSFEVVNSMINGDVFTSGNSFINVISSSGPSQFNRDVIIEVGTLNVEGIMQGDGALTIKSGSAVTLQNPSSSIRLNVINEGLIDGTAAKATIDSNLTSRGGEFQGLFDVTGTMTVESGWQSVLRSGADGLVEGQVFVNQSALSIQAGAVLRGPEALIVNGGQLSVNGEVRRNTVIDASSLLTGSGLFFGEVLVEGRLDPGNSAGTFGIDGSLTLGETSVVTIEIGGSAPGTYDVIDGRGVSVLNLQGGGLDLQFIDGFLPDDVMEFDIFRNFASINGQFGSSFFFGGNADGGDHGDRFHFDRGSFAIEYGATFVRLSDFQAAIPEPSTTWILGMITGSCLAVRRRRRETKRLVTPGVVG